jgi:hypothetical protein
LERAGCGNGEYHSLQVMFPAEREVASQGV